MPTKKHTTVLLGEVSYGVEQNSEVGAKRCAQQEFIDFLEHLKALSRLVYQMVVVN